MDDTGKNYLHRGQKLTIYSRYLKMLLTGEDVICDNLL